MATRPKTLAFLVACVFKFVCINGELRLASFNRIYSNPSNDLSKYYRAVATGSLVPRSSRSFVPSPSWTFQQRRNYVGISPRISGYMRNDWSSTNSVNRNPPFQFQNTRSRLRTNIVLDKMRRNGKTSKEVIDNRVKRTQQSSRQKQTASIAIKWRRIQTMLKSMSPSKRHALLARFKGAPRKTTSKEKWRTISNSKEVMNQKRTLLRKLAVPVEKLAVPVELSSKSHDRYLERSKAGKKKTSAEKPFELKHQKLSHVSDRKNQQKILFLQGFNKFLRQRLASRQTHSFKQSKKSPKGNKKTSQEQIDNGVNLVTKSRIKLHHNQTPNRPTQSLRKILPILKRHQLQFQKLKSYIPPDSVGTMHASNVNGRVNVKQTSSKQPLFVNFKPSSGVVTSISSRKSDKNTSKENKSGEQIMWVNP